MDWQAFLNSSASLLLSAFLLDLAVGDPRWFPHPVVLMGKFISRGEILLWTGKVWRDFICGMVLSLALIALAHPDKHNGSRLATETTQWLLSLRASRFA